MSSEKNTVAEQRSAPSASGQQNPAAPASGECTMISEKQFMRDHTIYSAISSWLFAIAGATNIGLLSVLASKVLTAVEQGKPLFRSNDPKVVPVMGNKKYNRVVLGMMAFGGVCMSVSNWLESKKVVTESQMLSRKLWRRSGDAETEPAQTVVVDNALAAKPDASPCQTGSESAASPIINKPCAVANPGKPVNFGQKLAASRSAQHAQESVLSA